MAHQKLRDLDLEPARYLNLGLASWLLVSAYLWRHSGTQFLITVTLGAVVAVLAPFEVGSRLVRRINLAAGALLILTAVAVPGTSTATLVNNVIVGLGLVAISFLGPPHGIMPVRPEAPADAYEGMGL